MTDTELSPGEWQSLQHQITHTPIGSSGGVICDECNGTITEGSRCRAYIVGADDNWTVSRVYHTDCTRYRLTKDEVGGPKHEGIVFGEITPIPEEQDIESMAGDWGTDSDPAGEDSPVNVIQLGRPEHKLTDLELGFVYLSGQGISDTI